MAKLKISNGLAYKKKGRLSFKAAFSNQKADKKCAMQVLIPHNSFK